MLFPANLLASTEKTKINKCSAVAEMGDHWPQQTWARKAGQGDCCPLSKGS